MRKELEPQWRLWEDAMRFIRCHARIVPRIFVAAWLVPLIAQASIPQGEGCGAFSFDRELGQPHLCRGRLSAGAV